MNKRAVLLEADFYCIEPIVVTMQLEESDACGGKLFHNMLKGPDYTVTLLDSMENHLVAVFKVQLPSFGTLCQTIGDLSRSLLEWSSYRLVLECRGRMEGGILLPLLAREGRCTH